MNIPPILKSLSFLKALAFVLAAVIAILHPAWVIPAEALLAVFVAILHLFGITPEIRAHLAANFGLEVPPIFYVLNFWKSLSLLIAGIVSLIRPDLALAAAEIEAFFLAVLYLFGIKPELRALIDASYRGEF